MTAAEASSRAEQRAAILRHSGRIFLAFGTALVLIVAYGLGVRQGHASEKLQNISKALENNAHALQTASRHRDSTKVLAEAAVQHSDSQRMVTRTARAKFAVVDDSTVAIKVPPSIASTETLETADRTAAATSDSRVDSLVDSLVNVPPPVVAYIRQADAQIHDDSVTIARMQDDIAALEAKDTLHVGRELLLERQVEIVGKAGFWRGAKVGAAAVLVARGVVWLVFHR